VSAATLLPPPAPSIDDVGGFLIQTNSGVSNSGGTITLFTSADGEEPWTLEQSQPWALVYDWGDFAALPFLFLATDSIGNGVAYSGPSEKSNIWNNSGG
jgi:hypothetical protein